ncbi:hypothetical protein COOONC_28179 [Cooperia oncophora]
MSHNESSTSRMHAQSCTALFDSFGAKCFTTHCGTTFRIGKKDIEKLFGKNGDSMGFRSTMPLDGRYLETTGMISETSRSEEDWQKKTD